MYFSFRFQFLFFFLPHLLIQMNLEFLSVSRIYLWENRHSQTWLYRPPIYDPLNDPLLGQATKIYPAGVAMNLKNW